MLGRFVNQFRQFMLRGGVFEFMVAFAIAGAFANLIRDVVQYLMTPLIALALREPEIEALTFTLDGTVFRYGLLLSSLLTFLLIAGAVYAIVVAANQLAMHAHHARPVDPTLRNCPECLSEIPRRARRCAFCCTEVRPFVTARDPDA